MHKNKFVNGPMNTIRLEGKIGNVSKIIYLFMDFHMPINYQTECDDIRSNDIDKFLIQTFDKSYEMDKGKIFDLFVEYNPLYPIAFPQHNVFGKTTQKGMYLFGQTVKLFNKSINIKDEKIYQSDELKNVRLHYADIREYTSRRYDKIGSEIINILNMCWDRQSIYYNDIAIILDGLKIIRSLIVFLYQSLYENKNIKNVKKLIFTENQLILSKYSDTDYKQAAEKLIYKMLKKYKNETVKNIIKNVISNELHKEFKDFFDKLDDIESSLYHTFKQLEPHKNKNIHEILIKQNNGTYDYGLANSNQFICYINNLKYILQDYLIGGIGLYLMDIYVLRRMLDKDYIQNAILYTGAAHSCNYIRILVKYFNFNITHFSYIKNNDIVEAEKIIKQSDNIEQLNELFYPEILKQCSNLEKFPDLFA